MSDIIRVLSDPVANQIAAGEVIQRPASVIKELVENSIDAGAAKITINVKDAGRTLIQIIDNGCGMSETDARLSFERHATSKIKSADDLYAIKTMGFRGEALASIAAIAQVDLITKRKEDELSTKITIKGSKVERQEQALASNGTNFSIKNLFFNVPARRKFLKADSTELRHILSQFQRIALCHGNIEFILHHNNSLIYQLPVSNRLQRIINIFGKTISPNLIKIETDTSIVKIQGYIGKPEKAKRKYGEQYFFVNGRFMKHSFFHNAIMKAYEGIILPNTYPSYFIYFEIEPDTIDVNIHPTKTEIKFENEMAIWQILHAAVKQSIGRNNVAPSIDFDTQGKIDIPVMQNRDEIKAPKIDINPSFNPFDEEAKNFSSFSNSPNNKKENIEGWEKIFSGLHTTENATSEPLQQNIENKKLVEINPNRFLQLKNKYILTPVKSGLMVIDQKRAHERILYEQFIKNIEQQKSHSQQDLFPETIDLSAEDFVLLEEIMDDLTLLGFDLKRFGQHSVIIQGSPSELNSKEPRDLIDCILSEYKSNKTDVKTTAKEKVAQSLAQASAIGHNTQLKPEEMRELFDSLFACQVPNYSPSGKTVLSIINLEELDNRFK